MKNRHAPRYSAAGLARRGDVITRRTMAVLCPSFLVGLLLLAATAAGASPATLPAGVPNIYDPVVRTHFQPVGVTNLRDNPDFPMVLLVNTSGDQPQALLLGLDARNGKDNWSLTSDPIILIVALSDARTIQGLYVDTGFADQGAASGTYAAVDEANSSVLPDLLHAIPEMDPRTYI